ncbi:unnamed protein product [Spirodela intermedia]|uniref:Uncharacterized protein n=1 Tax=Spirodela intermedia TaxID=51605 RepID=A0A7I8J8C2_SPIIN|nr:unnamed protein product [Spirodela intermedia]CAA6665693.1 unnamed protein product [Spirodela intermedia]
MAVAFGGFSIREYAAGMRNADASKCWPFDGEVRENRLPPIHCRKYRWWSSELQIARSSEACERPTDAVEQPCAAVSCDVSARAAGGEEHKRAVADQPGVLFLSSKTSTADEDGEGQTGSPEKAKTRTPKKRSIVELFAVAPEVRDVGDEEKSDNGEVVIPEVEASKEDVDDEELDWCSMEEQRKRKKENMQMPMRKRTKKNFAKKIQAKERRVMKKMKNKKPRFLTKQQKRENSFTIDVAKKFDSITPVKNMNCGSLYYYNLENFLSGYQKNVLSLYV